MENNKQQHIVNINVEVQITSNMLPLCCPLINMTLENMHSRIHLLILDSNYGKYSVCPLCNTFYVLCDE